MLDLSHSCTLFSYKRLFGMSLGFSHNILHIGQQSIPSLYNQLLSLTREISESHLSSGQILEPYLGRDGVSGAEGGRWWP